VETWLLRSRAMNRLRGRSRADRRAINACYAGLDPHYRYSHDLVDSPAIPHAERFGPAQPHLRPNAFTGQRSSLPPLARPANVTSFSSHLSAVSTRHSRVRLRYQSPRDCHAPAYISYSLSIFPQRPGEFPSPASSRTPSLDALHEIYDARYPDRKCEKVPRTRQIRPRAHSRAARAAPTCRRRARRVRETAHRRRLPLTDPRIHEWSVGYQWAANATHTRSDRAPPSLLPLRVCMLAFSHDRSTSDRGRDDARVMKLRRDDARYFFQISFAVSLPLLLLLPLSFFPFLFLTSDSQRREPHEDRTAGYDLGASVRERVFTRPRRESRSSWERLSRGRAKIASDRAPECEIKLVAFIRITSSFRFHAHASRAHIVTHIVPEIRVSFFSAFSSIFPGASGFPPDNRTRHLRVAGSIKFTTIRFHSRYLAANFQKRPFQLGEINKRCILPNYLRSGRDQRSSLGLAELNRAFILFIKDDLRTRAASHRALIATRATLPASKFRSARFYFRRQPPRDAD